MDHIHHPYWRLDFDVEGAPHGRVYLHTNYGWAYYLREGNDLKDPANNKAWYVANNQTGRGVWVTPGPHDGKADGFSRLDVGIRVYHPWEDKNPWKGKGAAWSDLPFANNEDVTDTDVVLWYVSHLAHSHHGGGPTYHETGPDMQVQL